MKKAFELIMSALVALPVFAEMEYATPESQGVDSEAIIRFIDGCEKLGGVHSFVIVRHGKTIAEGWWNPFSPDRTHMLYSHSKSFTSTAIGLLADDGKLDLDERIVDLFPEYAPTNPCRNLAELRIRDLLTMNVGATNDHLYRGEDGKGDWIRTFFDKKDFKKRPGTGFKYDSDATFMLAAIAERKSGMKLMDFLKKRLFDKIGIEKAWSTTSPQGIACGGWGMNMTTREIARFGQFYLQRGKWNGEQILSSEWVDLATARHTWSGWINIGRKAIGAGSAWEQGYGFQFWRCHHGAYRADGASGQYTIVMPEQDAVVSMNAGLDDMGKEQDLIWDNLLPAMKDAPLPENKDAQQRLAKRTAELSLPIIMPTRVMPNESVLGRKYHIPMAWKQPRFHFKEVTLSREGDDYRIDLVGDCGPITIPVGSLKRREGAIKLEDKTYEDLGALIGEQPTAAQGAWIGADKFRARAYLHNTTHYLEFTFNFEDSKLSLDIQLWGMGGFKTRVDGSPVDK